MSSTMPLFTAVLSAVLLGAAINRLAGVGLAIGLGGTAILASPSLSGEAAAVGIISLAVSALAWAFGNVYMKWRDFSRVSPVMLVGVQLVMSAVVLVPFALWSKARRRPSGRSDCSPHCSTPRFRPTL